MGDEEILPRHRLGVSLAYNHIVIYSARAVLVLRQA